MKAAGSQKHEIIPAERVRVVSLDVDICNFEAVVDRIHALTEKKKGSYVCMSTVHMIMEGYDDAVFGSLVNGADLVVPDGMPLVWMQKLLGIGVAERVRGTDLMIALFGHAERNGLSVGFYGGRQDVLDVLLDRAAGEYPDLRIAYAHSPPFRPLTDDEDRAVVQNIMEKAPDILFVGLGCPKQERWMASRMDELTAVMIGVGAAFDFYAGNLSECPKLLQKTGLEWLFRLSREPRRLWKRYLFLNPRFVVLACKQLAKNGRAN